LGHIVEGMAAPIEASPAVIDEEDLFSEPAVSAVTSDTPRVNLGDLLSTGIGQRTAEVPDAQAWQMVTLQLKPGVLAETAQAQLNSALQEAGFEVKVQDWVAGAGNTAQTVLALKQAFAVVIFIIILVAIFIVMNALMISISERTTEIGTMRALGARKKLVRNLILWEVFFLALAAGVVGVVVAAVVVGILFLTGIPIPSGFLQLLFASDQVRPFLTLGGTMQGWLGLLSIGLLAGWYPANTALRLSPLKAIQAD